MLTPVFPPDEIGRIAALRSLEILDTPPEERFDRLTRIAMRMFGVPIAQVSLIDAGRQWIKSSAGLPACQAPRDISFCAHAILRDEILLVEDTLKDQRFFDNPLVTGDPGIRFYAGCPLHVGAFKIGSFCLIDRQPRSFGVEEQALLKDLAGMVEQELLAAHMAATDELTRLANRRGFEHFARQALAVCKRLGKPAMLLFFDLNKFKEINDRLGHAEGDRALKTFADGLINVFRESDVIARLGGDEFAVLLVSTAAESADQVIERLRAWIDEKNRTENRGYGIFFSVGQVVYDDARHRSIEDMLREADAAMYEDKSQSRQC